MGEIRGRKQEKRKYQIKTKEKSTGKQFLEHAFSFSKPKRFLQMINLQGTSSVLVNEEQGLKLLCNNTDKFVVWLPLIVSNGTLSCGGDQNDTQGHRFISISKPNAFQNCAWFGEMPKRTTKERDGFWGSSC